MPRIPLYNQGSNQAVKVATGPLSRRPNIGALTASSQSTANFASLATKIATDYGMRERDREDRRIVLQEEANAYDVVGSFTTQDESTDVETASSAFDRMQEKLFSDIAAKGYGKRREDLIKNKISSLLMTQKLQTKQNAHNRGEKLFGAETDRNIEAGLRKMNEFPPESPQFQFFADAARAAALDGEQQLLPMRYNSLNVEKEIADKIQSQTRGSLADLILNAQTPEQVNQYLKKIDDDTIMSEPDKSVLRSSAKVRLNEIDSEQVAQFASHIPVENIGADQFSTVEALQSTYLSAINGNFGSNKQLQAIWDASDDKKRLQIKKVMQDRVDEGKRTFEFQQRQQNKQEKDVNDQTFAQNMPKIRAGQMTPQDIRNLQFVGAEGERLRSQLLVAAENRLRGAPLTKDNIYADQLITRKIDQGEIVSITQKFKLPGETEELSILERENVQLTSDRVDTFVNTLKEDTRRQTLDDEKLITTFLKSKELRVRGSNLLVSKPTPASDDRMETFTNYIRGKLKEGKEQGKSVREMLNNLDRDNFIAPEEVIKGFVPSKATLLAETRELLSPKDVTEGITFEEAQRQMPTRQDMGLPINAPMSEIEKHPLYIAWKESIYGIRFRQGP